MLKVEDDKKIEEIDEDEITHTKALRYFVYLAVIVVIGLLIFCAFDKYLEYSNYKTVMKYLNNVNKTLAKKQPIPLSTIESYDFELSKLSSENFENKKLSSKINALIADLANQPVLIPTGLYVRSWATGALHKAEIDTVIALYRQKSNYTIKTIYQPITAVEKKAYDISVSHPEWTKEVCLDLANRKLWIGMTKEQLILSWGNPKEVDRNVSKSSNTEQWIYGNLGPYVYLENGFVNSWQY
jgi:hypothetical protein